MRVKVTRIEIVDVETFDKELYDGDPEPSILPGLLDDFHDSLVNDILDSQTLGHETNDGKFLYFPRQVVTVKMELVDGTEKEADVAP